MDSQNKNTVFSHAASCARLNECTAAASVGELRALLKKKLRGNKRGLQARRGTLRQRGSYAVELPLASG